jgi:hypothetical protein
MEDLERQLARIEHKIGMVFVGVVLIGGGAMAWVITNTLPRTWGISEDFAGGIAFLLFLIASGFVARKFEDY